MSNLPASDLFRQFEDFPLTGVKMPALFAGHGSPMNAIEDNPFSRAWQQAGSQLPRPRAVLCISAHWETNGSRVTAMPQPKTIYDFYGFPPELYQKTYPAPGSPALAELTRQSVSRAPVAADGQWGLDHGAWSVLCRMYPEADIPVVQLSLDRSQGPAYHYQLATELRSLRRRGVLIVGSGNMVHNLRRINWGGQAFDWALEFDHLLAELIRAGKHQEIIHYDQLGAAASLSIPTNEHFLPLLYILAQQEAGDELRFFAEEVVYGSISMRCLQIGR